MRVLQVVGVVAERYGGPAIGALELNRSINRIGNRALLVSTSLNGSRLLTATEQSELRADGARFVLRPPLRPRRAQFGFRAALLVARAARSSDIIHIHGQYLPLHVVAYLSARITSTPYGIQPHGSLEPYQRRQSRFRKFLYDAAIGRRILRQASYVQFASVSEAKAAEDVVPATQATIVPLGAALPPTVCEPRMSGEFALTGQREDRVLFLGRLALKKRPDALIRAWARAGRRPQSQLIIAGPDGDLTRDALRSLAAELGVENSILIVGPVGRADKRWWYEHCGTFALPSMNENFGVAVAEAMLASCHVIASREVAASEHLERAGAGTIYSESDADALVNALTRALNVPDDVISSGQRAAGYAMYHLTWDTTARTMLANLREHVTSS